MVEPRLFSLRFLRAVLLAGAFAAVVACVAVAFLAVVEVLTRLAWEEAPNALDIDPHGWWIVVPLGVAAVIIGLLTIRYPGRTGHEPSAGMLEGAPSPLADIPVIIAVATLSLASGASLGPEAPLLTAIMAVGPLATRWVSQADQPSVMAGGIGSLFGSFLGAPLSAGVFTLEAAPHTGASLYALTIPSMVGGSVGLLVFKALRGGAFAAYNLPDYPGFEWSHVWMAMAIGAAGGVIGRLLVLIHQAGHRATARLGTRPITLALLGAGVMALIALTAGAETLFTGEHELSEAVDEAAKLGGGTLVVLAVGKSVALIAASLTGFRGGLVFPLMFVGGVGGLVLAQVAPGIPPGLAVGCGMAATGVALFRLPIFIVLFVAVFTGPDLVPLIVIASLTAYVIVHDAPPWRSDSNPSGAADTPATR
jgi:H+/Cl- antiporter ClcA